jgi:hypothetical protein
LQHVAARTLKFYRANLDDVELRADDLDWSFSTGTPLTGAAHDLCWSHPAGSSHQDIFTAQRATDTSSHERMGLPARAARELRASTWFRRDASPAGSAGEREMDVR